MITHWFWFTLTALVVVWYSSVTIYVMIRGAIDIREMLQRLAETQRHDQRED